MTANGLITLSSAHGVKQTLDRLVSEVAGKGMTVFARIDHAAGAREVGLALRPTELLIFGNARGGTPLMQALQTTGIDLPLKALPGKMRTANAGCPITIRHGSRSVMATLRASTK